MYIIVYIVPLRLQPTKYVPAIGDVSVGDSIFQFSIRVLYRTPLKTYL